MRPDVHCLITLDRPVRGSFCQTVAKSAGKCSYILLAVCYRPGDELCTCMGHFLVKASSPGTVTFSFFLALHSTTSATVVVSLTKISTCTTNQEAKALVAKVLCSTSFFF